MNQAPFTLYPDFSGSCGLDSDFQCPRIVQL